MGESPQKSISIFDGVSELYSRVRPSYPKRVIKDILRHTGLTRRSRVLELGAGTGQMTSLLSDYFSDITAVELGINLSGILREKFSGRPDVRILNGDFNTLHITPSSFDLVVAATSFHWLNPSSRMERVRDVLASGGFLAIADTYHVRGGTRRFFQESQVCYSKWDGGGSTVGYYLPAKHELSTGRWIEESADIFDHVFSGNYTYSIRYSAEEYADLLRTYSSTIAMGEMERNGFTDCVGNLIRERFGGSIRKRYMISLFLASKI